MILSTVALVVAVCFTSQSVSKNDRNILICFKTVLEFSHFLGIVYSQNKRVCAKAVKIKNQFGKVW